MNIVLVVDFFGVERRLVGISRENNTAYLCSPERFKRDGMEAASDHAVGFPISSIKPLVSIHTSDEILG